ncbi:MAG: hypothetical protein K8T25_08065 [Planctomycetia bacterium]|nr:hypothetical protein [Planctomycetia bacterium]
MPGYWLFSAPLDLGAFLGSAIIALAALAYGAWAGLLTRDTPDWTWVSAVLLIDVAHVWSTAFRVYFVPRELFRRPLLYTAVPIIGYVLGVAIYSEGELLFWRALAYLAVFHFVRQQYGWVMLYRARRGETDRVGRWIDSITIYMATIYPLIYWHAHLPRGFWWFMEQDFQPLPGGLERIAESIAAPIYWLALTAYALKSLLAWKRGKPNPGKDIVVVTTALCWYLGIVALNSDYAFTVTNVIIHGIPYLVLVYWYSISRSPTQPTLGGRLRFLVVFLATIWLLAYAEELFWDRGIWHERSRIFGGSLHFGPARTWIVPLLALPQWTHYVLDGFIWRRKSNPDFTLIPRATVAEPPRASEK